MYATEPVTITNAGQSQVITKAFTLNSGWIRSNLGASVFVSGSGGNAILNGRAAELCDASATGIAPSSLGRVKALYN